MRKFFLSFGVSLLFILFFRLQSYAYSEPNSYKCSIDEYWDCITDQSCSGVNACGRSPTAEGLMPICPTGYHCFCEDNDNDKDGTDECGCVECTSGCSDPFGRFPEKKPPCPPPTCLESNSGYQCLSWGNSDCEIFNPSQYSCTWYNEACCTSLKSNYGCIGDCSSPYRMMDFDFSIFDINDESTWCPSGWKYTGETGFDKTCSGVNGSNSIISGAACCKQIADCPGTCSPTCPPADRPELDGISLNYSCSVGLCCVENVVEPTIPPGKPIELLYKGPIIDTLEKIFSPVAKILYYGGLFIGVCFIIFSGYKLMVSQGNPQKTQDAQEQLTAAIFGVGFILLSAVILRIVINSIFVGDAGI